MPQFFTLQKVAPRRSSSSSTRNGTTLVKPTSASSPFVKPVTFLPATSGLPAGVLTCRFASPPFGEPDDLGRDCLHDPFGFLGVAMAVVNAGDAALLMVLHAVHGVPAKAERGHLSAVRAPEIMGVTLSVMPSSEQMERMTGSSFGDISPLA